MKKKVTAAVSIAVCAALGICACSSGRESSSFTGDATEEPSYQAKLNAISPEAYSGIEGLDLEPGTYISVIGKEDESAYWKQIKAGVEQAAVDLNEELGYSGDDEIKVIFNAPGEPEDIDEQVNILDEELARYPDVIAISSIDAEASSVQFDLATMNGIPIVAFESGNTYQGIQCTCSTDNTQAAQTAAQQLCSSIDEDGEVMLVVPDSVSQSSKDQVSAFREELLSNHLDVNLAGVIYMDQLDTMKRQAAAEQLNIAYDDVVKASDIASGDETAADSGDESVQQAAELLEEVDAIVGISISGVPLATLIAAEEGLNLSVYHPSKHNTDSGTGCISGNFSKISGKRCILVDDVITSGNTLTELVGYLRRHNATPVAILVIFDKRGMTEVDGVPVYSLFSIRLID